jgi:lipoprotein NlpD
MRFPSLSAPFAPRAALVVVTLALGACATRPAPVEERRAAPRPKPPVVAVPAPPPTPSAVPGPAAREPDWRPPTYTVKRGDTLQAIALEHGLDYRELAAWNAIENPNLIRVGQVLQLAAPGDPRLAQAEPGSGVTTAPLRSAPPVVEARPATPAPVAPPAPAVAAPAPRNTDTLKVAPRAVKEPYSDKLAQEMAKAPPETQVARAEPSRSPAPPAPVVPPPVVASPSPAPAPSIAPAPPPSPAPTPPTQGGGDDGDDLDWIWPAKGKIVTGFSDTANLKGIDIAGSAGQAIVASAPGRVVYAGSGLRGYGKLVIIKHNRTFLSAYAHNREIVVKEGQQVTRGQKIAEMGNTDADQVKLHFEIRRLGRPMDPMKYLPPA